MEMETETDEAALAEAVEGGPPWTMNRSDSERERRLLPDRDRCPKCVCLCERVNWIRINLVTFTSCRFAAPNGDVTAPPT